MLLKRAINNVSNISGNKESWYACCREKKNLMLLLGIEPSLLGHPAYNTLLH
jgi:hypothetical protein